MYSYPPAGPVRSRVSYWTRYPYKPRLGWGLFLGWTSAACLSLLVIGQSIAAGTTAFPHYHLTLGRILLSYWIAGTVLALVLAFAHPLIRTRIGSFILGLTLGWLAYAIIGLIAYGWNAKVLLVCLVPGALVGGGLGVVFHDDEPPMLARRDA